MDRDVMRDVLDVSLPVVGEMTVYTLMTIFDTMMIGNYGGNAALSAVGLSNEIIYTCINIFITSGMSVGMASLLSRSIGARRIHDAEEYASLGFTLGFFLAFVISFITYKFCGKMLFIAGAREDVLIDGIIYTKLSCIALFFSMLINLASAILRGYGDTYIPFLVSVFVTLIKIVLDVLLIFGFVFSELGIKGAAIASSFSQIAGFVIIIFCIYSKSRIKIRAKYIIRANRLKVKDLLILSVPSSFEEAAYSISRLLGEFIIMHAGTVAFASNQIANTIESLSVMVGTGFGVAATTIVGIKVGEKSYKKAVKHACYCAFWAVIIMVGFGVVFLIMPYALVDLFVGETEKEAIYFGTLCLAVGAIEQPSIAISLVFAGALKGYGDTKSPFYISLFSSWVIRLPLIYYFIYVLNYSVVVVWWITALQWTFDAVLMFICFKRKFCKFR